MLAGKIESNDPHPSDIKNNSERQTKAHEHLDRVTTCSDCEYFIGALEEIIDTIKKTDAVLDDINKLRLISEVQCLALKASRRSIRLQNREFKDYIEELKRLNLNKLPTTPSLSEAKNSKQKRSTTSPVPGTSGNKQRAEERKRSGNTTPPPVPAAAEEGNLSEAMDEESSSDESGSESIKTKETGLSEASAWVVNANGSGDLTDTEGDDFTVVSRKKKWLPSLSMPAKIQPDCSIH
ncbi:hypothetical protein TNIN_286451 [Trichonephila inaurata madagascariensis]|uniref:Uncharacterized protein n=1 Tax=Trichonephila inaurata madagascariensis TaxID=2747483 RepID=A0A8X7BZQ9_9ARAC|nr:hypothetical protein TNIN_286451 [Trichonephila inaurata madagascariensis]